MTKEILNAIKELVAKNDDPKAVAVREAVEAELNKGAAKTAETARKVEIAKGEVMKVLSDTPATLSEIWGQVGDALTEQGIAKGLVQRALNGDWADEVTIVKGKPNTYAKA